MYMYIINFINNAHNIFINIYAYTLNYIHFESISE